MLKFLFSGALLLMISGWQEHIHINHTKELAPKYKIFTRICIAGDKISRDWRDALSSRMSREMLDSVSSMTITISKKEKDWIKLIESKLKYWQSILDSLKIPFRDCKIPDPMFIFLGASGLDDGFTYGFNTVCLDVNALQLAYGEANSLENHERIDRIFAHEFTHLLHKEWARVNQLQLKTFKDSVLWECLYEGIGMYRSLSKKWLPKNGELPAITVEALNELTPIFVDRLTEVENEVNLDETSKRRIVANLSRGPVNKKWGAFPIAIWLSLEVNGDERQLAYWVDSGLDGVRILAMKYTRTRSRS